MVLMFPPPVVVAVVMATVALLVPAVLALQVAAETEVGSPVPAAAVVVAISPGCLYGVEQVVTVPPVKEKFLVEQVLVAPPPGAVSEAMTAVSAVVSSS